MRNKRSKELPFVVWMEIVTAIAPGAATKRASGVGYDVPDSYPEATQGILGPVGTVDSLAPCYFSLVKKT